MAFTLHQLQVFASVAKNGSMTKAAEELFMTQPAVSIQVKKLQEHFGVELFEVIGRKLYLTEAGKELFESQKKIQEELSNLDMTFSEYKGSIRGTLSIVVVSTAIYFMPYLLRAFQSSYEHVNISMKVTNRYELAQQLRENQYDLAVVSQLPDDFNLEVLEFLNNPLHMTAHIKHPLVDKKKLSMKDLEGYDFILREEGSGTRSLMESMFKKHDINPRIAMELSTNEAVKQAIMAGIGISLISELSIILEQKNGVVSVLDVDEFPFTNTWKLIYQKEKKLSPVAESFITFTKQANIEELIKKEL